MSHTKPSESGVAVIEFSLTTLLWVPLLLGTLFFGAELVRAMQAVQVIRDAASLYSRGVPIWSPSSKYLIAGLGRELNLQQTGGTATVIFTTIQFISKNECAVFSGTSINCTNMGFWVVTQRSTVGNASLYTSSFTNDPLPSSELSSTTGAVNTTTQSGVTYPYYLTDSNLRLTSAFNLLTVQVDGSGVPKVDGNGLPLGYGAGTPAYLVEGYFQSTPVPGFRNNPRLAAVALF
jgi:hypothetical protein